MFLRSVLRVAGAQALAGLASLPGAFLFAWARLNGFSDGWQMILFAISVFCGVITWRLVRPGRSKGLVQVPGAVASATLRAVRIAPATAQVAVAATVLVVCVAHAGQVRQRQESFAVTLIDDRDGGVGVPLSASTNDLVYGVAE